MRTWQKATLAGVLLLLLLLPMALFIYQVHHTPLAQQLFNWIFPMSLNYTTDRNGVRLAINTPYYVYEGPRTFSTNYFDGEILSFEAAELEDGVAQIAINQNQKIAYRQSRISKREPYTAPIDYERFGIKVNGIYFFGLDADGQINRLLSIEQALLEPAYVKADIFVAEIRSAEKVTRTRIGRAQMNYWESSGSLKEIKGFRVWATGRKRAWFSTFTEQGEGNTIHTIDYQVQTEPFTADIPIKVLGIKNDGRYLLSVLPDNSAGFPRPELDALEDKRHIELWVKDGQAYRATLTTYVVTGEKWTFYNDKGELERRNGYDIENGRKVEWAQKLDRTIGQRGGEWVPPRPQDEQEN
ncbi:hypothetical protein [Chromobacterium haemolyticum]|uniref:hypothetical protein n=1 Tax=Chromobacterium haemolyticum TaxID=394935 RepID=UPI0009DA4BE9|nr:hypothetical protein [Chromobacterium haemolyticum]OQS32932.1 hypothetical protein B0T40_18965 [Chromobacterium haemolyticum]PTU71167.1 hypothetical protein DBB33_17730 [Chromobacterium haemolyticum]